MSGYVLSHLSPSKLGTYTECPGLFRQRYVDKVLQPMTVPLAFGLAIHSALEAHFRGQDADVAFRQHWRNRTLGLRDLGYVVPPVLTLRGLELVEGVLDLNLQGTPERSFDHRLTQLGRVRLLGFIDLWDEASDTIVDFKSTSGKWDQARADRERWQPGIYSWAYYMHTERVPRFVYVILDRSTGAVTQLETKRSDRDIADTISAAVEIGKKIQAQEFDCLCKNHQHDPEAEAMTQPTLILPAEQRR